MSRSADSPLATVSRGEWSVSAIHSCPRTPAAMPAISPPLPVPTRSGCEWQSPRSFPAVLSPAAAGVPRPAAGPGSAAARGHRLLDHLGGHLADPRQVPQRALADPGGQLPVGKLANRPGRLAEGLHPVGRRKAPLQLEGDLLQGGHRVHALSYTPARAAACSALARTRRAGGMKRGATRRTRPPRSLRSTVTATEAPSVGLACP